MRQPWRLQCVRNHVRLEIFGSRKFSAAGNFRQLLLGSGSGWGGLWPFEEAAAT